MSLANIVAFAVRRRGVVLAIWAAAFAFALASVRDLSIDAVPDVTNTQVSILTSASGLSPLEVEQYLTFPIETAMNGVPRVDEIRSISRTGVSAVTVVFREGVDVWFARQMVSERLKLAENDIPPGYGLPELGPVSTGLGEIYEFYLASKKHTPMELRTMLDWVVAIKLRAVPGVVEVNGMGGEAKQYQVVLDPKRLAGYRLSLSDIENILEKNNAAIGAGYIEKNRESFVIRADAQFHSVEEIENTVVTSDADGTPVLVKQLGEVRIGPALRFGAVTKHGEGEIVAGTVMMLTGSNSRDVVHAVKARLAEIQKELPEGVEIRSYYDRAEFIGRMLKTVAINLAEGALLVAVVLFVTLGSWRGALIAALAIPLSMGIALLGMVRLGVTGNLMSLGAIDFGLLVDGAIVMLEVALVEIAVRKAKTREDIAYLVSQSMSKAARPVAFSLLIILLVYLPLMALEGVEGRMFKPMAITVALALGGALLFSLTAFPALAAMLLPPSSHKHDVNKGFFGRARRAYDGFLERTLDRPKPVLAVAAAALVLTGVVATSLGAEFVPRLDEGELSLDIKRLPSISITEAQRLGVEVEGVLAKFPGVAVDRHAHRARRGGDRSGRPGRDGGHGQAAGQEGMEDRGRSGRAGRGDQACGRRRGPRDLRVGVAADRGSREPAAGRVARRRRDQGVRTGSRAAEEDGRRDRQGRARHPGPRRLARPARARAAAARGQARSPAAGALRDERGPRAGGGRGVARRPLLPARSSRARGGSISCCCCRRRR